MKLNLKELPFFFLISVVLLLPLAQVKTVLFGIPLYLPEWALLGALLAFGYRCLRQRENPVDPLTVVDAPSLLGLGLFLGGAMLSFLANPFSLTGLGMVKSWVVFPLLFGLLLHHELRETKRRQTLLFVWLATLGGVALHSLSLFLSGDLTYDGRLAGMYASPNFLAYFIAPAPLLAGYFLVLRGGKKTLLKTTLLLGVLIASLSVLFLTRSYGVWGALLLASLVFCVGCFPGQGGSLVKKASWLLLPLLVVGSFFLFDQGSEKWQALIQHEERSSLASRAMIWQSALRISVDHSFFGIGIGRFQTEYLEYQRFFPPYLEWAVPEPHNFFLALFLATGVMGCLGFFLFMGRLGWLSYGVWRQKDGFTPLLFSFVLALWILFFVYGLTDTPYFKTDLAYFFFLTWALTLSSIEKKTPSLEGAEED